MTTSPAGSPGTQPLVVRLTDVARPRTRPELPIIGNAYRRLSAKRNRSLLAAINRRRARGNLSKLSAALRQGTGIRKRSASTSRAKLTDDDSRLGVFCFLSARRPPIRTFVGVSVNHFRARRTNATAILSVYDLDRSVPSRSFFKKNRSVIGRRCRVGIIETKLENDVRVARYGRGLNGP